MSNCTSRHRHYKCSLLSGHVGNHSTESGFTVWARRGVDDRLEDLVPWGRTRREFALLALHCADQAGMSLPGLRRLAEQFEGVLTQDDIDLFFGGKR